MFLTYRSLAVCNFQGRGSRELQGRASAVPSRRAGWFTSPKFGHWPVKKVGWKFSWSVQPLEFEKKHLKSDPAERKFKGWLKGCLNSTIFKRQCLWKSSPISCTEQSVLRRSKAVHFVTSSTEHGTCTAGHASQLAGIVGLLIVNGELHVFCLFQQRWYSNYISHFFKLLSVSPW